MVGGLLLLAGAASALAVGPELLRTARDGRSALLAGRAALLRQDVPAADAAFDRARSIFSKASSRLSSPLAWPLRILPVAGTHVGVGSSLASIGSLAADTGNAAALALAQLPGKELRLEKGRINVDAVARAAAAMRQGVPAAEGVADEIERIPTGWVIPTLSKARDEARDSLPGGVEALTKLQATLDAMPSILGAGTRKNYLVAFSNLSELRGSGGLFGFVTEMSATRGKLALGEFKGRPTEVFPPPGESAQTFPDWFPPDFRTQAKIFQNLNLTTDFPTVGKLVIEAATRRIRPLHAVLAVDPVAIAALLDMTGPINVRPWPTPITAANVERIAMHDVYIAFRREDVRQRFFEALVRTTFARITSSSIRITPARVRAIADAVGGGHLRMFSTIARDQALYDELGVSGSVDRAAGSSDTISLVSENATGNKGDWFLRRDVHYVVNLDPDDDRATTTLEARIRNLAPSSGLPGYIIGSPTAGIPPGTNRQIIMMLRAPGDRLRSMSIGGKAIQPLETVEGFLRAYRASTDIPSMASSDLRATSTLFNAFAGGGEQRVYRLHVLAQAVAHPDFLEVTVKVPAGWRAIGTTHFVGDVQGDFTMEVRVKRAAQGRVVDTVLTPVRWVRKVFGAIF